MKKGDLVDEEFINFYRLHRPQVVRYVVRRLRSELDDVVEEVFLTAWRKRDQLPLDESDQIVWLYAVARRIIANKVRLRMRLDRFNRALEPLIDKSPTRDSTAESVGSLLVHVALQRMRPQDREILLIIEWDGCTINEAASILKITPSAVGKRLAVARSAFVEEYGKLHL